MKHFRGVQAIKFGNIWARQTQTTLYALTSCASRENHKRLGRCAMCFFFLWYYSPYLSLVLLCTEVS
jgi:hypothetical protein